MNPEEIAKYQEIQYCYFQCRGNDVSCSKYSLIPGNYYCTWYETLVDDKRIYNNNIGKSLEECTELPTFSKIEQLLIDENNRNKLIKEQYR